MRVNSCYSNRVQNNKNPNFKARIRFVDAQEFERLATKLSDSFEVGCEWVIEEAAVRQPSAITCDAHDCVIVSIINPRTGRANMAHLSPYDDTSLYRLDEIKATLFEQAAKLKEDNPRTRLEGLILGGDSYGVCPDKKELRLLRAVTGACHKITDRLGMDLSVITERRHPLLGISVITDARAQTHYVHLEKDRRNYPTTMPNLKRAYGTVKVSPRDSLVMQKPRKPIRKYFQQLLDRYRSKQLPELGEGDIQPLEAFD